MNNATKQTVSQVKGGGAIEWVVTAADSETEDGFLYHMLPAAGIDRIGPFISFEHTSPAPAAAPLGVEWSVNAAMETAVVSYTFTVNHTGAPGKVGHHCIHAWTAVPADIIAERQASEELATDSLPEIDMGGTRIRLVLGAVLGLESPALRGCPASLMECVIASGAEFKVPGNNLESAVYVVTGEVAIDGREYRGGMMAVVASGWPVKLVGKLTSVVIVIGGVSPRISRQSSKWSW